MNVNEQQIVLPSHIFVELTSLAELNFLTNASTRIKFTCLSASPLYFAVGSSGGSVYLFSRYASKHRKSLSNVPLQVIPCKEGSVTNIKISPNEQKIATASSRGFLLVVNINGNKPLTTVTNVLHTGSEITALSWTRDTSRVYAGDSMGRLSCTRTGKTYFKSPCDIVLQLDSKIVEIDCYQCYVLISTLSRCYLHDFSRMTTIQIGKKLRSGSYGAVFFAPNDADQPVIFAARPGGRLWEVNCNGSVYNTHQFTTVKAPVASVVDYNRSFAVCTDLKVCNLSFSELYPISDNFLISINGSKGTVLDPQTASIVLFTSFDEDVVRYAVCGSDLFILTKDASLRKLTLFPYVKAVEKLQYRQCYLQAAQLIEIYFSKNETCPWKIELLKDVLSHLTDKNDTFAQSFESLVQRMENLNIDSTGKKQNQTVQKLSSGIHKVVKIMENSGYDDDFAFKAPTTTTTTNSLKRRCKSSPIVADRIVKNGYTTTNYLSPKKDSTSTPSVVLCRDDCNLTTPVRPPLESNEAATMTSSRSEESLISLLSSSIEEEERTKKFVDNKPMKLKLTTTTTKEKQAPPKIITSALKNGGKFVLNAFVQQLNVLSLAYDGSTTTTNGDSSSEATIYLEDDDDENDEDPTTPVAETPADDEHFFKDLGSPLFKNLSPVPNVIRRNPRSANRVQSTTSFDSTSTNGRSSNDEQQNVDVAVYDTSYISIIRTPTPTSIDDDTSKSSSLKCDSCIMHKSWLLFFRFCFAVRRLPNVYSDEVINGATPKTSDDWTLLAALWRSMRMSSSISPVSTICRHCKSLLNAWSDEFSNVNDDILATSSTNNFDGGDRSKSDFRLGFDRRTLEELFFRTDERSSTNCGGKTTTNDVVIDDLLKVNFAKEVIKNLGEPSSSATTNGEDILTCSMYYNPLYESFCETGGNNNENCLAKNYAWLRDVDLDLIVCCARKTLNDEAFDVFLAKNLWMNEFLTSKFYTFLITHDHLSALPNEIVERLVSDFVDDDSVTISLVDNDETVNSMYSALQLDLLSTCQCCTLPILAKVTEFESSVVVFQCGHAFHRVCLPKSSGSSKKGASSFCCSICNSERR